MVPHDGGKTPWNVADDAQAAGSDWIEEFVAAVYSCAAATTVGERTPESGEQPVPKSFPRALSPCGGSALGSTVHEDEAFSGTARDRLQADPLFIEANSGDFVKYAGDTCQGSARDSFSQDNGDTKIAAAPSGLDTTAVELQVLTPSADVSVSPIEAAREAATPHSIGASAWEVADIAAAAGEDWVEAYLAHVYSGCESLDRLVVGKESEQLEKAACGVQGRLAHEGGSRTSSIRIVAMSGSTVDVVVDPHDPGRALALLQRAACRLLEQPYVCISMKWRSIDLTLEQVRLLLVADTTEDHGVVGVVHKDIYRCSIQRRCFALWRRHAEAPPPLVDSSSDEEIEAHPYAHGGCSRGGGAKKQKCQVQANTAASSSTRIHRAPSHSRSSRSSTTTALQAFAAAGGGSIC